MRKSLSDIFDSIARLRVLVIGDVMLDRYIWGNVDRISPEAPVPVVDVRSEENRLGGAANVAMNIRAMGAEAILCGGIGADKNGEIFLEIMRSEGFATELIYSFPRRRTTTKTRIISQGQHILRVDWEDRDPVAEEEWKGILEKLLSGVKEADAVIFEDYDKGMLVPGLIEAVIAEASRHDIPVVVDPKFRNFFTYAGCRLFKPNLKELNEGLGLRLKKGDEEAIMQAVKALRAKMPHKNTLITLGEFGVAILDENGKFLRIPAHSRKIIDVSGAGDTVAALLGLALGAGLAVGTSAQIANLGGGLVCEEVGVVPVDRERLLEEMERLGLG